MAYALPPPPSRRPEDGLHSVNLPKEAETGIVDTVRSALHSVRSGDHTPLINPSIPAFQAYRARWGRASLVRPTSSISSDQAAGSGRIDAFQRARMHTAPPHRPASSEPALHPRSSGLSVLTTPGEPPT